MHKHICILIKVYLASISAIHKYSISNQMGVVDGRANRVTRLMTYNEDVYLRFLLPRAFIWYPTRPTLGWWWRAVATYQKWVRSLADPRYHINTSLWFLTSRAFVWYPTWLILIGWQGYRGDQIHRKTCST